MIESKPIRVLLVDDHAVVRSGLAAFLLAFDDMELVGEASSGEEALSLCGQVQPDVVLMDLVMPEMDGAAATRAIRERHPQIQVIALTSFKEKDLVQGALDAGAIGYLLKNVSTDDLADAIRAARHGQPTLAPEASQSLILAEKLERLARTIISAPTDASTFPELLADHVPRIFSDSRIEIRIFPDLTLLRHPANCQPVEDPIWEWVRTAPETNYFLPKKLLPWGDRQSADAAMLVIPIMDIENTQPIGGIYLERRRDPDAIANFLPSVRSLAAQIASTLHRAQLYEQTLAQQRIAQELALAGQIQASFLPSEPPKVAGWQLSATLEPARETSGDFYDFILLPNGQLGIVVADVAGKGMGAALYMAVSRTLIRTYATEHPTRPDLVLRATNRRIMADTRADLFVTVFYGILDPATGTLTYGNAGHNPPYHLSFHGDVIVQSLSRTGLVLGVFEDVTWKQNTVQLAPGDVLLLYSDGITEAQNQQEVFFDSERLLDVAKANLGRTAEEIQNALIGKVFEFVGDAPQFDDMTAMVIIRG